MPLSFRSVIAAPGLFSGAVATGIFGFATAILFLVCTSDFNTLFALDAPQPFVQIYAVALGRGGAVFMSILAIVGLILVRIDHTTLATAFLTRYFLQNTSIAVVAASHFIYAVARDGVLPGSKWIGKITEDGQTRNAVTVMFISARHCSARSFQAKSHLRRWFLQALCRLVSRLTRSFLSCGLL